MAATTRARIEATTPDLPIPLGDWRQFGNDPRDMPDWALVASLLWGLESSPDLKDRAEVIEARRLYDAGEIDAASESLQPILVETIE